MDMHEVLQGDHRGMDWQECDYGAVDCTDEGGGRFVDRKNVLFGNTRQQVYQEAGAICALLENPSTLRGHIPRASLCAPVP